MSNRFTTAIIVAAGESTRMGYKISKQLIPINGRPAIEYTIRAFQNCDAINEIIVVARPKDIDDIAEIAFSYRKVMAVISGGADRADSVRRGIKAASRKTEFYAIHDGARILISDLEIRKVVAAAIEYKAATLGTPLTDTVKVITPELDIQYTPVRSTLCAVQTPQVFERELYIKAMNNALEKKLSVTDDCSMVEALGERVKVVRGEYTNIKLTTPADIIIAEAILSRRN